MQKQNPVIKNYILSSEKRILLSDFGNLNHKKRKINYICNKDFMLKYVYERFGRI